MLGIFLGRVVAVEHHALIAEHTRSAVGGRRVHAPCVHRRLGTGDEEGAGLMHRVQASEVHIASIHHVEGPSFHGQDVEYVHVMQLAVADVDERRDRAAQVQQRVQLDGRLGRAKRCPLEQAQAQIDGGCVQRIDAGIEVQHRGLLGIQRPGPGDQALGQRVIDAPVALVQRIGQRRASRRRLQPHVEQLGLIGRQADLDVAKRLAPGELREGHDTKQLGAAQRAHARIALVSLDDAPEGLPRHELHDLRKKRLAHIHASPRVVQTREHRKNSDHARLRTSTTPSSLEYRKTRTWIESEIQIVDTPQTATTRTSTGLPADGI